MAAEFRGMKGEFLMVKDDDGKFIGVFQEHNKKEVWDRSGECFRCVYDLLHERKLRRMRSEFEHQRARKEQRYVDPREATPEEIAKYLVA